MRLVVDANILVAELIRKRGRDLVVHPALELYIAQMAWEETCHELGKRVEKMVQKGVFSQEVGQNLLVDVVALARERKYLLFPMKSTPHTKPLLELVLSATPMIGLRSL